MSPIIDQQENLLKLFKRAFKGNEVINWNNANTVGFSILKDYPKEGLFKPAYTKKGKMDSVALIKIGYYLDEINQETLKVRLIVTVIKASRYLLDGHWDFNFDDKQSPTSDSIESSKTSRQPYNLTQSTRYELSINNYQIWDTEENKRAKPIDIVESIYKAHLRTLTNYSFRFQMFTQKALAEDIPIINDYIIRINTFLTGRTLKQSTIFLVGISTPYPHSDLVDLTTEKIKIAGSDFPITNQSARTATCIILLIFFPYYLSGYDFVGINKLLDFANKNPIYLAALTVAFLYLIDRLLPHIILRGINLLIRIRMRFLMNNPKLKD